MGTIIREFIIDCADSRMLARFWGAVLGLAHEDYPEGSAVKLPPDNWPSMIFFREVHEAKRVKNRLHFDLNPVGGTLADEINRLTKLGAVVLSKHRRGADLGWAVMADLEGNEFCIQSSDTEVAEFLAQIDSEDVP